MIFEEPGHPGLGGSPAVDGATDGGASSSAAPLPPPAHPPPLSPPRHPWQHMPPNHPPPQDCSVSNGDAVMPLGQDFVLF